MINRFKTYIERLIHQFSVENFLIAILAILFFFALGHLFRKVFHRIANKHLIKEQPLLRQFIISLANSATFFMLTIALYILSRSSTITPTWHETYLIASKLLLIFSVGYFSYLLVEIPCIWYESLMNKDDSRANKMFLPVIRRTLQIIVAGLVLLQIAQLFSTKPITSLLAGLGIGGLAVALAAQDTLKHFIGSFVLAGDKPFEIGERIVVDGYDGPVESVGLRSTRIRTLEGHLVSIPNGELANKTILNIGKRPHIRQLMNIGLTYDTTPDKLQKALDIVKELLDNHEGLHEDFPPKVYFNNFNADSLNILVLYWYHPADYWAYMDFNQSLNFSILERFNREGIEFAFPTQTIHLKNDSN